MRVIPKKIKPQHFHKFIIPVEWEIYPARNKGKRQWRETHTVTKLRCVCGEEWIRCDHE